MSQETPKVVPLHKNNAVEMFETLLKMAKSGEVVNFIAAGHLSDGNVFTTVVDTDVIKHHTLISYLQTNVIMRTAQENS